MTPKSKPSPADPAATLTTTKTKPSPLLDPAAIQQPTIELKMDKITLPTFDGDLTHWLSFKDQFVDLVHTNPRYTAITKFIQLRNHLKGMALEAINGFKLSASNYDAAWYVLTRRYDKPDRIIEEYLKKLDNLPVLAFATSHALISMVNCTNQILRVLPVLGINVTTWDTIIKYKLTSKLDRTTHKKWLDQVKLRQNVPLQELIEFLEVEASENLPFVQPQQQQAKRDHNKRGNRSRYQPGAAILTTTTKSSSPSSSPLKEKKYGDSSKPVTQHKCPQCKANHPLYLCNTFKQLSVRDRINKVRGFKLCNRCLRSHASQADCTFGKCPVCTGEHNKLLCYTKEKQDKAAGAHVNTTSLQE